MNSFNQWNLGQSKGAFSYTKCFLVFHFKFSRKWKGFSISRKQIKILKTRSKLEMLFSFSILENLNTCWRCGKRGRRRWKMKMKNEKHQNVVFQLHAIKWKIVFSIFLENFSKNFNLIVFSVFHVFFGKQKWKTRGVFSN